MLYSLAGRQAVVAGVSSEISVQAPSRTATILAKRIKDFFLAQRGTGRRIHAMKTAKSEEAEAHEREEASGAKSTSSAHSVTRLGLGCQKTGDGLRERVGVFDVAEVRAVKFDVAGAGDVLGEKMSVGRHGGGVVRPGDHKSGGANSAKLIAKIEVANRRAVREVAFWICGFQHFLNWGYRRRIFRAKGRREPALDGGGADGLHALLANGVDTCVPHFQRAEFGRGAGENQFVDALRSIGGEPHADSSAHGEAAKMEAVEFHDVGQSEDVFGELLDGIRAGRD